MVQTAWIWWTSGGALALAGLWLLWWSLLRDRARGRRRCPKCWYDMGGVPGLVCPECGRDAKREKRLSKTRRRWGSGALGGLASIVAAAVLVTPRVCALGPASLLPTTILLWASPTIEQTWTTSDNRYLAWLEKQHDSMLAELSRRASTRKNSLTGRQWRNWIERKHVIHAWRSEDDPWTILVQVEMPLPLGNDDAIRLATVVPTPAQLEPADLLIGPLYPKDAPPAIAERPPPTGWVVSTGTAIDGWRTHPGSVQHFSLIFPPRPQTTGTPVRSAPTLSAQLWDRASESLELDVEYLRDRREHPSDMPDPADELVIWRGRVTIPIQEQTPPWYSPLQLLY